MFQNPEIIRFNVLRNAHYHTARRLRFSRLNRWSNLIVILLGAAAMGDVLGVLGIPQIFAGAGVAFAGAIQLVFDFAGSAREHQQLQRDYYNLLADIEAVAAPDVDQCTAWYSRMVRIAAEEPPVMRAVDAKAYNDTVGSMEWPDDQRLIIPWWQRPFRHLLSFEGYSYVKIAEVAQRRRAPKSVGNSSA